jgi:two-component system phosphate regulon response regulator PhoB
VGGAPQAEKVLVVEDESDIGSLLDYMLRREGFRVALARCGQEALGELRREPPDLIVLDLMLPDMSGIDVLEEVRRSDTRGRTKVIILSARKSEEDRLRGFELGAVDYMVKPFSPRELMYRIRTALRHPREAESPGRLIAGPIEIDLEHHDVRVEGAPIQLTLTEFRLLADMVRNQGRVRSRDILMSEVWGYDSEAMSRTVDTHVRRLRSKLGSAATWLGTVRGVGYRIRDPRGSS